jgi:cysteine desulfurase
VPADKLFYFDNAATTPIHPKVIEKMLPFLKEHYGNASSVHSSGRKARVAIEEARETIAEFINAKPGEIYFTSGGTESNNTAIFGISKTIFNEIGKNKIITGTSEHPSVLESCIELKDYGFNISEVETTNDGNYNFSQYQKIYDNKTALVSLMHVNNETGAINDIKLFSKLAHSQSAIFHTDAVQSFGKFDINVNEMFADSLSGSAHKIQGPKGIGFFYLRSGTPFSSYMFGGSQERNRRGGTENVASIVGFCEAVNLANENMQDHFNHVEKLKSYFIQGLQSIDNTGIKINSLGISSPYIASLTFDENYYNNDAESLLMNLDLNGIAASNGSACSSGTIKPSHVILAMGQSAENAKGTIRFSFGPQNKMSQVDFTLEVIKKIADRTRK